MVSSYFLLQSPCETALAVERSHTMPNNLFSDDIVVHLPKESQPSTGFFQLCPELRLIVYEFVFHLPPLSSFGVAHVDIRRVRFMLKHFLSLLETCRAVYWEARLFPFKYNIFDLTRPVEPFCPMHGALELIRLLRPWQIDALQGVMFPLSSEDIVGMFTFSGISFVSPMARRGLMQTLHMGPPIPPLFDHIVTAMSPAYLHFRDDNKAPYKVVGPLEASSNWPELLREFVGKNVVISRLKSLPKPTT